MTCFDQDPAPESYPCNRCAVGEVTFDKDENEWRCEACGFIFSAEGMTYQDKG